MSNFVAFDALSIEGEDLRRLAARGAQAKAEGRHAA
jgi:hypothetical protein